MQGTFQGPVGCFLLGIAAASGWTPCTGPILAGVLVYAGTTATVWHGAALLFLYAMGFSLPFFIFAVVYSRVVDKLKMLYPYLPLFQKTTNLHTIHNHVILFALICFLSCPEKTKNLPIFLTPHLFSGNLYWHLTNTEVSRLHGGLQALVRLKPFCFLRPFTSVHGLRLA